MISTLHIRNIGIIEDLTIDFNKGLNVLTGETGAGKTLIIDSLQVISGGRFSKEMIRRGEETSFVELCMYEPENENSIEGNIIVSREIHLNGRNMCKINGRMVTVTELKEFMSQFIEIHGQNDNQKLLDNRMHLNYLDGFIGKDIIKYKDEYMKLYREYNDVKKELSSNYGDDKERQRKLDLLEYQRKEIEDANLKENEDDELEEQRKIMQNSEKILTNLQEADQLISDGGIDSISIAIRSLEKIEHLDSKYSKASGELKSIYYELQELSRDIYSYKEDMDFDEEERNNVEERLDLINDLKRKYGNTINEILEYKEEIEKEIEHITNLESYNNKLKNRISELEDEMEKLSENIHTLRKEGAQKLNKDINNQLIDLEMKNAKINIHVDKLDEFQREGKDSVVFYIATNVGEKENELSKTASGGEMSRIMLAIKKVLAETDETEVLIFDEIDTGISGKAANSVANKLKDISKNHQVMCISHLPNIAAKADYNYFISKDVNENRTKTQVKLLKGEDIIKEIARISSGEINEVTLEYARKLREPQIV